MRFQQRMKVLFAKGSFEVLLIKSVIMEQIVYLGYSFMSRGYTWVYGVFKGIQGILRYKEPTIIT